MKTRSRPVYTWELEENEKKCTCARWRLKCCNQCWLKCNVTGKSAPLNQGHHWKWISSLRVDVIKWLWLTLYSHRACYWTNLHVWYCFRKKIYMKKFIFSMHTSKTFKLDINSSRFLFWHKKGCIQQIISNFKYIFANSWWEQVKNCIIYCFYKLHLYTASS